MNYLEKLPLVNNFHRTCLAGLFAAITVGLSSEAQAQLNFPPLENQSGDRHLTLDSVDTPLPVSLDVVQRRWREIAQLRRNILSLPSIQSIIRINTLRDSDAASHFRFRLDQLLEELEKYCLYGPHYAISHQYSSISVALRDVVRLLAPHFRTTPYRRGISMPVLLSITYDILQI